MDLDSALILYRQAMRFWPEKLAFGETEATLEECLRVKSDVAEWRRQALTPEQREFLDLFHVRLQMHIGQLKSDTGRCFF